MPKATQPAKEKKVEVIPDRTTLFTAAVSERIKADFKKAPRCQPFGDGRYKASCDPAGKDPVVEALGFTQCEALCNLMRKLKNSDADGDAVLDEIKAKIWPK